MSQNSLGLLHLNRHNQVMANKPDIVVMEKTTKYTVIIDIISKCQARN